MCLKRLAVIALIFGIFLLAQGQASSQSLDITITPDKTSYIKNEIAYLTIHIKNNTEMIASNIRIQNLLPEGLVYVAPAEAKTVIAAIQPGQEVKHVIRLKTPTIPQTGDRSPLLLWGTFALLAAGLLIWCVRRRWLLGMEQ